MAAPLKLKRSLALLVCLSELRRKVSRLQMLDLLWPDAAPDVGRARLRRLVHRTNAALGVDLVVGDADAIWLAEDGAALDSDVVHLRACAQRLASEASDAALTDAAHADLQSLLEDESHGVLEGFDLDSESFAAWLDVRRSEQRRLVARALHRATERLCGSGQASLAAQAAARLIALDPLADAGHAMLLVARSMLGDAAGVEAAYFACAEVLRGELGVRPSAGIELAFAQARARLASADAGDLAISSSPTIRFADTSDGAVAYFELGSGERTLVLLFGAWSHAEVSWEEPRIRAILDRLARRWRVVLVDRRGTGLSERMDLRLSLRTGVEDIEAVRRALGTERIWLMGNSVGGTIAIEYAATYGPHVEGLVLYATGARGAWAPDYPWALTEQQLDKWLSQVQASWGGAASLAHFAPSAADDEATQAWWARNMRQSASKNSCRSLMDASIGMDVRHRLPEIRVPTLVVQRAGDRIVREGAARYLAAQIAGARLVVLPGQDHLLWIGDTARVLDEVEQFIEGTPARAG